VALSTALSGMVGLPAAPRADAEGNVPGRTKPVPGGAPPAWSTPRMSDGARVSAGTPQVSWPSAATGSVSMAKPAVDARDRAVATPDSRTRVYAPGTPVWAETGVKSTAQGSVDVRVIDHAQALKAGVDGLIVTAKPGADLHDEVTIGVDYSAFEAAYGGGFGARLRLYALPECALTTPDVPACRVRTEIPNRNDAGTKSVTTTVGAKPVAMAPDATVPSAAPGMAVFALAASSDPASGAGNYSATSLSPEGSWSGGTQSGSFTYSYPVPLPPAASSLAPKIGLSYDSGSVDGTTAATQSQSSWVGDGWNTPSSFVERTYVPCSDSPGGSPSPVSTKDQCYAGEILTLSLNGSSAVLVWDAAQGVYKSTSEPGTVVTRVTGSNNGSGTYNTEYWKVTDRSGTVYMFGRNQLPGWSSGKPLTNSVDSVPVFSSHAGDPCYNAAGFAQSSCTMGYRWNLDYVVDLHQNAMAYYYKQDTNFYGKNNGAANVSYVRASYLDHIDYGFTDTNAYTAPAPNQVAFVTGERCVSGTCSPLNDSTKANWSDVPYDLNCNSGATCSAKGPSFWSTVRLKEISTKQYASTQYNTVDTIELQHTMPATGDAGPATLFLAGITRTGKDTTGGGSTSPIALPQVQFAGQAYPNRVDDPNDGLVPLYRYRISQIKTSTGATFGVSYTPTSDCVWPVSITPSTNTSRCFPVKWTPPGYSTPQNDWFHKYAVATVTQSDNSGAGASENQRTSYTYTGAAWHYDDNEVVKAQDRTWGQWRGYAKVQVRTGQAGQPQTLAETSYYQGMDGDTLPSGTRSVVLTDSQGGTHTDTAQLAGSPLESTSYLGDGGPIESSTISSYWVSDAKAIRNRTGLPALTSRYTGVVETWSRQAITSGATPTWRVTQTDQSYDTTTGLATFTNAHGDVAKTDQSTCTTVTYAPANTALNLVGLVAESETVAKSCGGQWPNGTSAPTAAQTNALAAPGSVSRPADVVADTRTYYDDATLARTWPQPAAPAWPQAAPTKGDVSITRSATNYTGGAYTYQTTSATVADSYGRPIEVYDARGNKTTTAYTTTAGLVTGNTVTNALGQTASVTIRPARGLTVGATDINNVATTSQYDSLGRLTSVWGANRATSSPANATFTYSLSQTQPSVVTTAVLNNSLGFDTTYKIYDSLLRERQTQSPTPQGGRMLTNTFYDSHGWVIKQNAPHWDDSTTPNGTLFIKPDNVIPNQQRLTLDGLGRTVIAISQRAGTDVEKTTTVYGGDRVTTVPPAGGIISATVVDALERNTEIDQYSAAPTVGVPADTFAGRFTLTGGTSQATKFTYNRLGRLATKIDAANNTWTTGYNMLGQATSQAHPDSGTSMTAYDAAGNMSSTTDARNVTVSYGYDVLNRKTAQYDGPNSSSPLLASWEYDGGAQTLPYAKGKLTSVSSYVDGSTYTRKVTTGFNVFGSALDNTVVIPSAEGNLAGTYTVTNKYSADLGLPTKKIYTAHGGLPTEIVNFGYTTMDMPATIGGNLAGYVAGVTYDAYKRPILEDLTPTGATGDLSFVYDDHTGALKTATYANGAGALHSVGLSYDLAGNVTRESTSRNNTTTETQCYGYDTLARLTQAWTATDNCAADPSGNNGATVGDPIGAASAYWTTWQIDPVGNRTKQTRHGLGTGDTTTDYNYPPAGPSAVRPHALTSTATTAPGGNTTTSYDYDNAGNTTARNLPTGSQVLKWDHRGKLATVKTPTGTSISSYIYDAEGGRLIRRDPGRTTLYLSGEELVLDTTSNTVTGSRFYPLVTGGQAIRTGTTTTAYKFEITDHHNTGTLSLDNTAQIPTWRQSSPYGEPRGTQPGSWPTQHGFLNAPANTNTGLVEIGAREYDPTIGRFTAVDPVVDTTKPQSLTGYGYVENSPVVKSDPSGLTSVDDRKGTCRERATDCKAAAPPTNPWGSSLVQKTAARVGIPSKSRWRPAGNVGVGSLFWSWLYSDRGRQPVDVVVANENDDITKLFMQSDSFSNVRRTVYGQLALGIDSGWGHNSIVSNPVANALRGTSDGVNVLGEGLFDPRNPAGVEAYLGSYDVNFQVESKTRDTVTVDVVISNRSSIGSATRDPVGGGSDSKIVKGFLNGGIAKVTGLRPGTGGVPKIDKQQDQWQLMEFRMSISCATTVTIGTDVIRSVCPAGGVN
jgi:RHS repeat-associated protein